MRGILRPKNKNKNQVLSSCWSFLEPPFKTAVEVGFLTRSLPRQVPAEKSGALLMSAV